MPNGGQVYRRAGRVELGLSDAAHLNIEVAEHVSEPLLYKFYGAITLTETGDPFLSTFPGCSSFSTSAGKSRWACLAAFSALPPATRRPLSSTRRHNVRSFILPNWHVKA